MKHLKLIDQILDKINKSGLRSLSFDERTFLNDLDKNKTNVDLEKWLCNDSKDTLNNEGVKTLFDEFEDDEDIFYNHKKLSRIITKHLNKEPFTNNADWGSGYVWNLKSENKFTGTFLYFGDDELILLKRDLSNDEYQDKVLENIFGVKDLYRFLLNFKKKNFIE